MLPITSRDLPVQGYPGGELSELRAYALHKNVEALDLVMRDHPDNAFRIGAAFDRFRRDLTQMGLRDCAIDRFTNGAQKRLILEALARCHVASTPLGRQHLRELGEYPLQAGASSLYLLGNLSASVRPAMLSPPQAGELEHRPEVFPCGLITVRIPGVGLRLPLMPECFGAGEGAITSHEYETLMQGAHTSGSSIRDWVSSTYRSLSRTDLESLARTHEKDACAYAAAGRLDIAADRYDRAIKAFADADRQTAVLRCLAASRDAFSAMGGASEVVATCRQYAEDCEKDGRVSRAAEIRRKVSEFHAYVDRYGRQTQVSDIAAGVPFGQATRQQRSDGVLWRALESEIAAKLIPMKTSGMKTPMGTVYFKFERDCVSFEKFEVGKHVRWCLLRRADGGDGADAVFDLITDATANRLRRENLHPQREDGLRDGDIVQGIDMMRALLPAAASGSPPATLRTDIPSTSDAVSP